MAKKNQEFIVSMEPTNIRKNYVQPVDINENFVSTICYKTMMVEKVTKSGKTAVKDTERVPLMLVWDGKNFTWNLARQGRDFQIGKETYIVDRNIDNNPMLPDEKFVGGLMEGKGSNAKMLIKNFEASDFFKEIQSYFERYFYLEKPYLYKLLTLFVVNAWVFDAHEATPYLFIRSPVRGCGKSHLGESIAWMCHGRMFSPSAKAHHIFRAVHFTKTVLVFDEIKKWTENLTKASDEVKDIISLVNSGFQKGGSKVDRLMNAGTTDETTVLFDSYSPKVMITTTGRLPVDTTSRCIELIIQRAPPRGIDFGDRWYEPARKLQLKKIREMGVLFRLKYGNAIREASENVNWRQEMDITNSFKELRNRELEIFRPLVILTLKYMPEWKEMVSIYITKFNEMRVTIEVTPSNSILWALRSFYSEVQNSGFKAVHYDEWGTISIEEDAVHGTVLLISPKAIAGRVEEQTSFNMFGRNPASQIGKELNTLGFTTGNVRRSKGKIRTIKVTQLAESIERYLGLQLNDKNKDKSLDQSQRIELIRQILVDNSKSGLTYNELITEINGKMGEEQMRAVTKHLRSMGMVEQKGKVLYWIG